LNVEQVLSQASEGFLYKRKQRLEILRISQRQSKMNLTIPLFVLAAVAYQISGVDGSQKIEPIVFLWSERPTDYVYHFVVIENNVCFNLAAAPHIYDLLAAARERGAVDRNRKLGHVFRRSRFSGTLPSSHAWTTTRSQPCLGALAASAKAGASCS
jgi:hypothetical protein